MKKLMIVLLSFLPLTAAAEMIKTSSVIINPEFSLADSDIRSLDKKTISILKIDDEKAQDALNGKLLSYNCEENDSFATSYYLTCTYIHDLPRGWDWFGFYEVTYKQFGSDEAAIIRRHYRWIYSENNASSGKKK